MPLTAEQQREAARCVAQWRTNQAAQATCLVCGQAGLAIVDRSARMRNGMRSHVRHAA